MSLLESVDQMRSCHRAAAVNVQWSSGLYVPTSVQRHFGVVDVVLADGRTVPEVGSRHRAARPRRVGDDARVDERGAAGEFGSRR